MNKSSSLYSDNPWSDVTSKLHLAKKKLAPVIKNLMESSSGDSDHPSITVDEYSDAVWAAEILAEVEETLEKSKRKRHMKLPHNINTKFDFPTKVVAVNELGKVYVDTSVLVQLIELHQSLGAIIKNINEGRYNRDNLPKKEKKKNSICLKVVEDQLDKTQYLNMEENNRSCNKVGKRIVVMTANVVSDNRTPEDPDTRKTKSTESQKSDSRYSQRGETSEDPQTVSGEGSSSAQEILLEESDLNSSKIVICIKGQNEEDLQIVIRQCPECKQNNIEAAPQPQLQPQPLAIAVPPPPPPPPPARVLPPRQPSIRFSNSNVNVPPDGDPSSLRVREVVMVQGGGAGSDSESTEKTRLSMLFNVQDPTKSIVDCVPINMYDPHQVCIRTDGGEELLLTLTVAPKNPTSPPPPGPLPRNRDTQIRQNNGPTLEATPKESPKTPGEAVPTFEEAAGDQPFSVGDIFSEASVKNAPSEAEAISNDELLIPLYRTKVCSSLQLDVERLPSRMRHEGIVHEDKSISMHFNKLGVDKILRASRPVKCARKAVLNETSKKSIPYSPSLKSLPLEEADLDIINQSLEMSVTKSRSSTVYIRKPAISKIDRYSNVRQVYYFHVHVRVPIEAKQFLIKKKLQYHIFLNSDLDQAKDPLAQIFDIHSCKKPKIDKATNSDIKGVVLYDKIEKKRLIRLLHSVREDKDVFTMKESKMECKRKRKILPSRLPIYKYRRKGQCASELQLSKAAPLPHACLVDISPLNIPAPISSRKPEEKLTKINKPNKKVHGQSSVKCSFSHLIANVDKKFAVRFIEPSHIAEPGLSGK